MFTAGIVYALYSVALDFSTIVYLKLHSDSERNADY